MLWEGPGGFKLQEWTNSDIIFTFLKVKLCEEGILGIREEAATICKLFAVCRAIVGRWMMLRGGSIKL